MELSKCYIECAKIDSDFRDENGDFKIFTNTKANYVFKIEILKIKPIKNDSLENDYIIGIETKHLTTLEEKTISLKDLNEFYF